MSGELLQDQLGTNYYFVKAVEITAQALSKPYAGTPAFALLYAGGAPCQALSRLTARVCSGAVFSLAFAGFYSNAYEQYYVGGGAGGVFCAQTGTTHSLAVNTSQTYAAFVINQATQPLAWAVNVTQNASSALMLLSSAAPAAAVQGTVRASALLSPPVPALNLSAIRLFVDSAAPLSEGARPAWLVFASSKTNSSCSQQ